MSGAGESWPEARAFPRVEYPSHLRPYLQVAGETCEVVDCSEQGLRYGSAVDPRPVGSMVNGRIRFRSGVEVAVRGTVVRVQGGEVALSLEPGHGIPAEVLAEEETVIRGR